MDLWQTLIYDPADAGRMAFRARSVAAELRQLGHPVCDAAVLSALQACEREHDLHDGDEEWPPHDQVTWVLERLGIPGAARARAHEAVIGPYGEAALAVPPEVFPDAEAVVAQLAGSFRLALICNTGATPGRVLRVLLDRFGLLRHFTAVIFSDEIGYRKPSPRAFYAALRGLGLQPGEVAHIGDNPLTDVHGAKRVGLRGVLLTGGWHGSRPFRHPAEAGAMPPDAVAHSLADLTAALRSLGALTGP